MPESKESAEKTETSPLVRAAVDHPEPLRMNGMDRRTRIAIVAIIVVVSIILLGFVVAIAISKGFVSCNLDPIQPQVDLTKIKNIPSEDLRTLASFKGFLKYTEDPSDMRQFATYMNLEHNGTYSNEDSIVIDTSCAKISMMVDRSSSTIYVYDLRVDLRHPNLGTKVCWVRSSSIKYPPTQHYSCFNEMVLPCTTTWPAQGELVVAFLYIEALEFEQGGWPNLVKQGHYTRPAYPC